MIGIILFNVEILGMFLAIGVYLIAANQERKSHEL